MIIAVKTVYCYLLLSYCLTVNDKMFFNGSVSEVVSARSFFFFFKEVFLKDCLFESNFLIFFFQSKDYLLASFLSEEDLLVLDSGPQTDSW